MSHSYVQLLGPFAPTLPAINFTAIRKGPALSDEVSESLCRSISYGDIDAALCRCLRRSSIQIFRGTLSSEQLPYINCKPLVNKSSLELSCGPLALESCVMLGN